MAVTHRLRDLLISAEGQRGGPHTSQCSHATAGPRNFTTMGVDERIAEEEASRAELEADQSEETWLVGASFAALRWCALVTDAVRRRRQRAQTARPGPSEQAVSTSAPMSTTEALVRAFSDMVRQRPSRGAASREAASSAAAVPARSRRKKRAC